MAKGGAHSQHRSQGSPDASRICRALFGNQGVRGEKRLLATKV